MTCLHGSLNGRRTSYPTELRTYSDTKLKEKVSFHRGPESAWIPGARQWMASAENRLWHRMVVQEARRRGL